MNEKETVAVIIVNYNSENLLHKCLSALRLQTVSPTKIIVIDNGSKEALSQKIETTFPEATFIRLSENTGFAAANNLAVTYASNCEWIALLNPDAYPEPNWLAALLEATKQHPDYSFFGSHLLCADNPSLLDGVADIYHVSGRAWREGNGRKANEIIKQKREIFGACAAAALYKREIFVESGGFDEKFFCYFEDVDLAFRLRLLGYKCLYVPDAVVHHQGSAITKKSSDFCLYYGHRNLVWTYVKNMPSYLFWIYLPYHIFLNIFTVLFFALKGRFKILMKAKFDSLRELKTVWRQRRLIQSNRRVNILNLHKLMSKGLPF